MAITLREWSLSLGLMSQGEDDERAWDEREIGPPKDTDGFEAQEVWSLITRKGAGQFKTSVSKGHDITNPVLRLAQMFSAYNLLDQASPTITTAEVYFMWCMLKGIKVHLGYWIAQACHTIATYHVRHLYACHLLEAYMQKNITMKLANPRPSLMMCDAPDLFDIRIFINTGLVKREGSTLQFYEVGQSEGASVKVKKEVEVTPTAAEETWKKMMEEMLRKLGEATAVQRGLLELQIEKMTKALTSWRGRLCWPRRTPS